MSTYVNRVGVWVKKGQKFVNIVCERPLRMYLAWFNSQGRLTLARV